MPLAIKKIELQKEMYQEARTKKLSFSEFLEQFDPIENYQGSALNKLDAFQRQLSVRKINLVRDFFETGDSVVLFPEFINRNLQIGMEKTKMEATLSEVASTTSTIDGTTYHGIEVDLPETNLELARVSELSEFPVGILKTKEKETTLNKIGLQLKTSYESLRRSKINTLAIAMQLIGRYINKNLVHQLLEIMINGDGNSNPASVVTASAPGNITWDDLVDLDMAFDNFEPDFLIGNKTTIAKILKMDEFKHPLIGADYLLKGKPFSVFGNSLRVNKNLPNNKLLAFNRLAGVEILEEKGASMVETEQLIEKQFQRIVISKVIGFNKMFADSSYILDFS